MTIQMLFLVFVPHVIHIPSSQVTVEIDTTYNPGVIVLYIFDYSISDETLHLLHEIDKKDCT